MTCVVQGAPPPSRLDEVLERGALGTVPLSNTSADSSTVVCSSTAFQTQGTVLATSVSQNPGWGGKRMKKGQTHRHIYNEAGIRQGALTTTIST